MIHIFGREQSATSAVQYFVGEKRALHVSQSCMQSKAVYIQSKAILLCGLDCTGRIENIPKISFSFIFHELIFV